MTDRAPWEVHGSLTAAGFKRLYGEHQLLVLRGAAACDSCAWMSDPIIELQRAFRVAPQMVTDSFTSESGSPRSAEELLGSSATSSLRKRKRKGSDSFYASFIVQPSGGRTQFDAFLKAMPVAELLKCLRPSRHACGTVTQADAVWVFFGCGPVAGRAEHTDAVEHDGTWHVQCTGRKVWHLRPTDALLAAWSGGSNAGMQRARDLGRLRIVMEAGDVLLLNTRLWHMS